VVQGGTVISVTRAKNPVERISSAILDARPAVTFGVKVNELELDPFDDPPAKQDALRL